MQVVPILNHQNSNYANIENQNTLEQSSKLNSGDVINFQTFQATMVSMNLINPISESKNELSSKRDINKFSHQSKGKQTQQNNNGQEISGCRERLKSDATSHLCWLCKELQKHDDPFVCNCKCSGSNQIHAACLMKIVNDEISKKQANTKKKSKKDYEQDHGCSICKHKFKSKTKYKLYLDLRITYNNILFIIFGLICIGFSVGLIVISNNVFLSKNNQTGNFSNIYTGLIIFLGVICIIVTLSFLVLAIYMFYKAFFKIKPYQLEIVSEIKDRLIIYLYDEIQQTFKYDIPINNTQQNKELKTNLPTLHTQQKSPQHQKSNEQLSIEEQNL